MQVFVFDIQLLNDFLLVLDSRFIEGVFVLNQGAHLGYLLPEVNRLSFLLFTFYLQLPFLRL